MKGGESKTSNCRKKTIRRRKNWSDKVWGWKKKRNEVRNEGLVGNVEVEVFDSERRFSS